MICKIRDSISLVNVSALLMHITGTIHSSWPLSLQSLITQTGSGRSDIVTLSDASRHLMNSWTSDCKECKRVMEQAIVFNYEVVQTWPGLMSPDLHTNQSRSYSNHLALSYPRIIQRSILLCVNHKSIWMTLDIKTLVNRSNKSFPCPRHEGVQRGGSNSRASRTDRLTPGERTEGWMGPRTRLDRLEKKKKIFTHGGDWNSDRPTNTLAAIQTELCRLSTDLTVPKYLTLVCFISFDV